MTEFGIGLEHAAEFVTVHARHHHVADDKIRLDLLRHRQSHVAVFCFHNLIARRQPPPDVRTHIGVVLDEQDGGFGRLEVWGCGGGIVC